MKFRSFLVGIAGGAVGAALVVLVLVLAFNFGEVKETVVTTGASQLRGLSAGRQPGHDA